MQEVVSTEVSYAFDAKNTTACTLTVTDAWGATDTDEVVITVEGNAYTATFEDVYLKVIGTVKGKMILPVTELSLHFIAVRTLSVTTGIHLPIGRVLHVPIRHLWNIPV